MTAYEIINAGFALAGEKLDSWPDKDIALGWLNTAMAISADAENLIRESRGQKKAEAVPYMQKISDVPDMDEKICRGCLPYAIAFYLLTDREREYSAEQMNKKFYSALYTVAKGVEEAVADCYGGGI